MRDRVQQWTDFSLHLVPQERVNNNDNKTDKKILATKI